MSQSNKIFGALVLAFVVYITLRGQLPDYFSLFTGADSSTAPVADKAKPNENPLDKAFKSLKEIMSNMGLPSVGTP